MTTESSITSAAVIGGGTMGAGIAQALRLAGINVTICDADESDTRRAKQELIRRTEKQVGNGLREPSALDEVDRVRAVFPIADAVAGVDLVCEAVVERAELKREVLSVIARANPSAIVATNTSSYPIDELADVFEDKARFLGLHWFNPAELVPGVEVVYGTETSADVVNRCVDLLTAIGKNPAVVASSPGFIANRLQMALFAEALSCVRDGLASPEAVDEVVRSTFGFRLPHYGPFRVADMAGLDVYASIFETLRDGLGPRFSVPEELRAMVEDGRIGAKAGAGFMEYSQSDSARLMEQRDRKYAETRRFLRGLEEFEEGSSNGGNE